MRNLKRALSLTLASVMLLGMMVLGTSAASYPDVTDEHNVEAIGVLQAIGVMSGSNNGNFNPDAKISRIEMAIVMANLLNLEVNYFQGQNTFSDVPEWASGYVNACAANGIVTGVGGGRFGTGNVTATQAALMMLKALGYFQYNSDFGDDWARATALQASKINLFKDLEVRDNTQLTRNHVAQLALNALEADMVDADTSGNLNITTSDGTVVSNNNVKYVVRTSQSAFAKAIDSTGNEGSSSDGRNGSIIQLGEQLYNGDLKRNETSATTTAFQDPAVRWSYKTKEIGTYAKSADLTYTKEVKLSDIYADLGLSTKATTVKFAVDGDENAKANDGSTVVDKDALISSSEAKVGGKGSLTKVYYNESGEVITVTITVTNYYLAKAAEDYDSNNEELDVEIQSGAVALDSNTLELEDFAGIVSVKENDYLLVTVANNEIKTMAPVEVVGDVVVTAARSGDYVTAGQKYEYNSVAAGDSGALGHELMAAANKYSLNDKGYNLYLDPHGYVLGVEAVDGKANVNDYVFIKDAKEVGYDYIAKAVFTDGTSKTITVDKLNGEDVDSALVRGGNKFYTFKTDKDGNYELTDVENQDKATDARLDNVAQPIRNAGNTAAKVSKSANASTVFIAKDQATVGVKNAPETKTAGVVYYVWDEDNTNRLLIVYTEQKGSNSTSADDIVYILNNKPAVTEEDGDTYYLYQAVVNGDKTTEFAANQNSKPAGLYVVNTRTDGRADLGTAVTNKEELATFAGFVKTAECKDGTLILGSKSYLVSDSVKIRTIDGNTVKTISPSGVKGAVANDGFNLAYVIETSSSNSEISIVYLVKSGDNVNLPSGSGPEDISDAFESKDEVTVEGADLGTNGSATTVPANKTLTLTGDAKGKVTNASGGEGEEDGKIVLDNISVKAGEDLDLSGATGVEFKGTTAVPSGSTLKLPADLEELPKLTGTGTVTVNNDIPVPQDESGDPMTDPTDILGELQTALGMEDETMGEATTADGKDTYTITIGDATGFAGDKKIGAYSDQLSMDTIKGYYSGATSVSFHQFTITQAMAKSFNTVKITYKIGEGGWTAVNDDFFGKAAGSTLPSIPEGDSLTVILPLGNNVSQVKIELSTVADGGGE